MNDFFPNVYTGFRIFEYLFSYEKHFFGCEVMFFKYINIYFQVHKIFLFNKMSGAVSLGMSGPVWL